MGRVREKILKKLNNRKRSYLEIFIGLHELFLSEYGWIPLDEFLALPMQTVLNLFRAMEKRYAEQNKKIKKGQKKGR